MQRVGTINVLTAAIILDSDVHSYSHDPNILRLTFLAHICDLEHCELLEKVSQSKSKTPTASRLECKEMKTYGGMPMADDVVVVTCINCDKPMIPSAFKEHRCNYLILFCCLYNALIDLLTSPL